MLLAKAPRTALPEGPERPKYEELVAYVLKKERCEASLIDVLHRCQNLFGYIPRPAMLIIGEMLDLHASKVYGVVTFYSYFTEIPTGKYNISVCLGTACYVKGAQEVLQSFEETLGIKMGQTTEDLLFSISPTRCLGDCSRAPVVMINDELYGNVTPAEAKKLVQRYRKLEAEKAKEGVQA